MVYFYRKVYFMFATIVALTLSVIIYQAYIRGIESDDAFPSGIPSIRPTKNGYEINTSQRSRFLEAPVILWWTPFGSDGKLLHCGRYRCYVTSDRSHPRREQIKSFLFYGSDFRPVDLPEWRSDGAPWGLLHEESPRNEPMFTDRRALNLFAYSATFSRFSHVPLTLVDLPGSEELLGRKYFVSTEEKTRLTMTRNLAPLLYVQSDCDTASNRDLYVAELMKHVRVDSYGACLNNVPLDRRLKENYLETLNSDEFLSFVANYKFTIAFENAVCEDYVTEKLWRPLIVGSVPIYYGSPSFKDWLPNNRSAISVLDFDGPLSLAKFLRRLLENETEYEEHLSHKLVDDYRIENERLRDALQEKARKSLREFGDYVEEFECFVCRNVHENREGETVNETHYDCPLPRNPLTNRIDRSNWWTEHWLTEKCAAKVLSYRLRNNLTINAENLQQAKLDLYNRNEC